MNRMRRMFNRALAIPSTNQALAQPCMPVLAYKPHRLPST